MSDVYGKRRHSPGIDPDVVTRSIATFNENYDTLVEYITSGYPVNARNSQGDTALIVASKYNHLRIVKFLLANDADPNARNRENKTALFYASKLGHDEIARQVLSYNVTQTINLPEQEPPLVARLKNEVVRADNRMFEAVKLLLENGSAVGKALMIAIDLRVDTHVINLIIPYTRDHINDRDANGNTALTLAVINTNVEAVKSLLLNGADPNIGVIQIHMGTVSVLRYVTLSRVFDDDDYDTMRIMIQDAINKREAIGRLRNVFPTMVLSEILQLYLEDLYK
jgi:ankyrin repeat protein